MPTLAERDGYNDPLRVQASNHFNVEDHTVPNTRSVALLAEQSPGVARIAATNAHISFINRICILIGIFLIAYAYGLDGTLRFTYQPYATASFNNHSLLATVNVLRSVIAVVAQPVAAKIGRLTYFSS